MRVTSSSGKCLVELKKMTKIKPEDIGVHQILEHITLRKQYHMEARKRVPKRELPYLEAYLRELLTVEKFVSAVARGDWMEVNRMDASTRSRLIPNLIIPL